MKHTKAKVSVKRRIGDSLPRKRTAGNGSNAPVRRSWGTPNHPHRPEAGWVEAKMIGYQGDILRSEGIWSQALGSMPEQRRDRVLHCYET
jgi:hypothetical protein